MSEGTSDPGSASKPDPSMPQFDLGSNALHLQHPTPAFSSTKIRLSLLATGMVDALGGPPEFHNRFSFPFVDSMIPNQNFNLPAGVWTDDTSMTLCLADSIATYKESPHSPHTGGFNEIHQLELYTRWQKHGYLSAVGRCFDIGSTTSRALRIFDSNKGEETFDRIRSELSRERFSGNGSLMRVIPVGLAYWRDEPLARNYGKRSSLTTHPNLICVEACEMWTGAIALIMQETTQASKDASSSSGSNNFSKLGLLEYISNFPYTNSKAKNKKPQIKAGLWTGITTYRVDGEARKRLERKTIGSTGQYGATTVSYKSNKAVYESKAEVESYTSSIFPRDPQKDAAIDHIRNMSRARTGRS